MAGACIIKPMELTAVLVILVVIAFWGGGLIIIVTALNSGRRPQSNPGWPSAKGKVISSEIVESSGITPEGIPFSTFKPVTRFRYLVATHCGVAVQNVHAYIAGEHGDSEIPLWSSATIGSIPLNQWAVEGHGRLTAADKEAIVHNVKNAAYQVIQGKGATNYAVGLAVTNILEAILYDERRVLPVSGYLSGFRGMEDVCLSLPRIVGRAGIQAPLPIPMTVDEEEGLQASAARIREAVRGVGY